MKSLGSIAHYRAEIFWGTLALLGCLAMLAFEALSFRLMVGNW